VYTESDSRIGIWQGGGQNRLLNHERYNFDTCEKNTNYCKCEISISKEETMAVRKRKKAAGKKRAATKRKTAKRKTAKRKSSRSVKRKTAAKKTTRRRRKRKTSAACGTCGESHTEQAVQE